MLIGLDGIPLSETLTGVGHYTVELARSLALLWPQDRFEIVSPRPFVERVASIEFPENLNLARARVNIVTRRWWMLGLPGYVRRRGFSLFHGTNYEVPLRSVCPSVLTIHDLSLLLCPETHEPRRVRRARLRLPIMVRAATVIITPTESVRHEVVEHLGVAQEKVFAVPEAPREIFSKIREQEAAGVLERLRVERGFLLFVGTVEPRKNLVALVRALDEITRSTEFRPQLVVAGRKGWLSGELLNLIESSGAKERVRFTGYVSDSDLRALYSCCSVFVYPSVYEGFGLPPLEAMACGAPVIAGRSGAIAEVVRDAAILVEPEDHRALAANIVALLKDEGKRERLSSAGLKRAAEFSWERTAQLTGEVYKEAIKRAGNTFSNRAK